MKKDPKHAEDRMISGKLRAKAGRSGAANTMVSVDGTAYAWAYRHGWLVWGKGIQAISISVSLRPGRTRELILDFTMKVGPEGGSPSDARAVQALGPAIRSADRAGGGPGAPGRDLPDQIGRTI